MVRYANVWFLTRITGTTLVRQSLVGKAAAVATTGAPTRGSSLMVQALTRGENEQVDGGRTEIVASSLLVVLDVKYASAPLDGDVSLLF
jgi:hypothetical protein